MSGYYRIYDLRAAMQPGVQEVELRAADFASLFYELQDCGKLVQSRGGSNPILVIQGPFGPVCVKLKEEAAAE